jgi:lincosamide nucleotidyltransferase A/C/D/E
MEKPIPTYEGLRGHAARLGLLARRRAVPAARAAYYGLERSPLAFLLRVPVVARLKSRITYMPQSRVLALMDDAADAGPRCWIAGGWGIDALLGRQTRRHYDLDLVISDTPDDKERIGQVLTRARFRPDVTQFNPGQPMPTCHVWRDDWGCTVEVLPVALDGPPFDQPFAHGTIGGQEVPCLSASLQFALHEGYDVRSIDEADMDALRAHVNRAQGTPPA